LFGRLAGRRVLRHGLTYRFVCVRSRSHTDPYVNGEA
jgi:hypothetical protein